MPCLRNPIRTSGGVMGRWCAGICTASTCGCCFHCSACCSFAAAAFRVEQSVASTCCCHCSACCFHVLLKQTIASTCCLHCCHCFHLLLLLLPLVASLLPLLCLLLPLVEQSVASTCCCCCFCVEHVGAFHLLPRNSCVPY